MKNRSVSYEVKHPPVQLSETLTINYEVRISHRARHVRLRISAHDGLTVVAPPTFDLSRIPAIVETKKSWIAAHVERFAACGQFSGQTSQDTLPEVITLPALGESWRVEYCATKSRSVAAMSDGNGRLVVRGAIGDEHACRAAMRRWLARRAADRIVPWLEEISEQHGLPFSRVVIKGQKTRWGSCSRQKTISLNYKLLFLDPPVVRYILLHELCHTKQLNHSHKFWALVMSLEPGYRDMVKELGPGMQLVPGWAGHARRRLFRPISR